MTYELRQAILEMLTQIEFVALNRSNVDLLFRARDLRLKLNRSY